VTRTTVTAAVAVSMILVPSASATVPKPEFIGHADRVCERFEPRIQAAIQTITYSPGFQEVARNTEHAVRLLKHEIDRIQRLPGPDRGGGLLQRWYHLSHETRRAFLGAADAARHRDVDAVEAALDDSTRLAHPKRRAARRFGFRSCR
jgi:hypothetical protein